MCADYPDIQAPPSARRDTGRGLGVGRQDRGGRSEITLSGEIDLGSAPLVRAALQGALAGEVHTIEVDLSAVEFCDCAGLSVFLLISQRAAAAGGRLRLRRPQPAVARLFALSGTDTLLLGQRVAGAVPAPAPCVYGAPG